MKCVICKHGETQPGSTTVTVERSGKTVVFQSVPAAICRNCDEEYVDDTTTAHVLETFNAAVSEGVVVDIRQYNAA